MKHNEALLDAQLQQLQIANERRSSISNHAVVEKIKAYRVARIKNTYSDLYKQPRYQPAIEFLLNDLVGTNDLGKQGVQFERAKPAMLKILPSSLINTVAKAISLVALTMELDTNIAQYILDNKISDITAEYPTIICGSNDYDTYIQQINLITAIGGEIESVVHKPFIATALKMCRKPAQLMQIGQLQDYLERGFHAFKTMHNSKEFLSIFEQREIQYLDQLHT